MIDVMLQPIWFSRPARIMRVVGKSSGGLSVILPAELGSRMIGSHVPCHFDDEFCSTYIPDAGGRVFRLEQGEFLLHPVRNLVEDLVVGRCCCADMKPDHLFFLTMNDCMPLLLLPHYL